MKSARDILHSKCSEKNDTFLTGQVGWITEAMEEYAEQIAREKLNTIIIAIHIELNKKTGWGRNQIKETIKQVVLKHYFQNQI